MNAVPHVGRCRHCQQTRPLFRYDLRFDNGDEIWTTPYPPYWGRTGAWLCARDWSAAETARVNGRCFHVEHELVVWSPDTRVAMELDALARADADLRTCEAILATTKNRWESTP